MTAVARHERRSAFDLLWSVEQRVDREAERGQPVSVPVQVARAGSELVLETLAQSA